MNWHKYFICVYIRVFGFKEVGERLGMERDVGARGHM